MRSFRRAGVESGTRPSSAAQGTDPKLVIGSPITIPVRSLKAFGERRALGVPLGTRDLSFVCSGRFSRRATTRIRWMESPPSEMLLGMAASAA
jgi:hypothetical protein